MGYDRAVVLKLRKAEIPRPEIKKKEEPKPKAAQEAAKPAAK